MELDSILRRLRRDCGLTQPEVARYLAAAGLPVSHKAVSKWERGVTRPDAEQLLLLCRLYGVRDVQAAFFGAPATGAEALNDLGRARVEEYIRLLSADPEFSRRAPAARRTAPRIIPLYELPVSAGCGLVLDSDNCELVEAGADVPRDASFAVAVSGDSMTPRFADGQTIFVRRQDTLEDGECGIFIYNGAAYCKRLSLEPLGLVSLNPAYPVMRVAAGDELHILGKVVG